jgi:ABC transporter substrate binding protein (PQQ-dependent alcohol dehydrogenase system)
MTGGRGLVAASTLLPLLLAATLAQAATFRVTLLAPADDERLSRTRLERAVPGHATGPAADALKVALAESQLELDAAGAKLELAVVPVADANAARAAAAAAEKAGAAALVADLPPAALLAAADAVKLPVINVSAAADTLREAQCRRNLLHTALSERMKADALAQALVARRWSRVLLLVGPSADDTARSATAQASLRRYGLKVVGSKPFRLSADPRERDLANPRLLTNPAQGEYDVVWVVDSDGEFAVGLPYRTLLPRPVVGDAGLVALAWSAKFERYGAPQVTRRLLKAAGRPMAAHDWSAWMAGKALVAAAVAAPALKATGPAAVFAKALEGASLDGSKGVAMAFRPWDGQLRQPVLLATSDAVIDFAPAEGVLHPKNNLDTLGADGPERLCKAR